MSQTLIALLATGGTIACAKDDSGALVPRITGAGLVADLDIPGVEFRIVEVKALDSSAMTLSDVQDLAVVVGQQDADPAVDGILITHGTDSLEETALALDLLDFHTPIVLTGAQRPFDDEQPDGPANLRLSVESLCSQKDASPSPGVHIVFGSQVLAARGAYKRHTEDLEAFASLALPRPRPVSIGATSPVDEQSSFGAKRVEIVSSPLLVDACIAAGVDGIVVPGKGSGNVSPEMAAAMRRAPMPVVLCTRVPEGPVASIYGGDGGGATLAKHGIMSTNLRAPQARIALAMGLAAGLTGEELRALL
ncbi:MAG: asparaginase [Corynebacterium sp.]|nr:asparaginase [Corynebacterium sp.]